MSKNKNTKSQKKVDKTPSKSEVRKQEIKQNFKLLLPLILTFAVWLILDAIVISSYFNYYTIKFFINITTEATLAVGKITQIPMHSESFGIIKIAGYTMKVVRECTAYNFYLFALPLVLFSKWSIPDKIINILIFFASILVFTILRFIILAYVGKSFPSIFDYVHDYLWNVLFALLIFGLWLWRSNAYTQKIKKQ